jgi:hypothetical protein
VDERLNTRGLFKSVDSKMTCPCLRTGADTTHYGAQIKK